MKYTCWYVSFSISEGETHLVKVRKPAEIDEMSQPKCPPLEVSDLLGSGSDMLTSAL